LQFARTIDDVLDAINGSDLINVRAETHGDSIRLVDETNETINNLQVSEVGLGDTAADLGLASINVAADSAVGGDLVRLTAYRLLSDLNNGAGLSLRNGVADLEIEFRDGIANLQIDFEDFQRDIDYAVGTTIAANGATGEVTLTAKNQGEAADGYTLKFVDSGGVTKGNETVVFDQANKTITVDIQAGATVAADVTTLLNNNSSIAAIFNITDGGDGSGLVDISDVTTTSGGVAIESPDKPTVGDLLRVLNAADPTRLQAQISADGDHIELTDLTSGGGNFSVTSPFVGTAAEDLGLVQSTTGNTLSSHRLLAGLKTSLLSSLNGGSGLGTLGTIQITDRAGVSDTVDLAGAETLDDIIQTINASSASVEARVNRARNGIEIVDKSGGSGNLSVSDGDTTGTATLFGLASSVAASSINGGGLQLQTISEDLLLSKYNGGVADGSFTITNSAGQTGAVSFSQLQPETLGDVIDAINALGISVKAGINENGDGISLTDTAGGSGSLTVTAIGNTSAAEDLGLTADAVTKTVNGQTVQVITSSTTNKITISSTDSLDDIVERVNALNVGVTATVFNQGLGSNPFRLALVSQVSGRDGELLIDTSSVGFQFDETASAQDALLVVGNGGGGILSSSATNTFKGVLKDVNVTILSSSA
jgi:flagellar hook-associated protein 2